MQSEDDKQGLFGDFSSRDPNRKRNTARAAKICVPVRNISQQLFAGDHTRKPAGKTSFLVDDRKTHDRRKADSGRRSNIRMSEDRRSGKNRRDQKDPWDDKEFRT
jgi:hypothetical protein